MDFSKDKVVILKPGKEKPILNHHHWIFSGAILESPKVMEGEILAVCTPKMELLGYGYFNSRAKIIGRMLSYGSQSPIDTLKNNLEQAISLRAKFFENTQTNAYRLVNGEGDFLPGLVVDRYADGLVLQISTLGMEKLKEIIIDILKKCLNPKFIYEKSNSSSRKEEGLSSFESVLDGTIDEEIEVLENSLKFIVEPTKGQKTGFFLDHREMREQVRGLSKGKRVLNCFAYTGGFSIYAAKGGAESVDSVDISESAMHLAERNSLLNEITTLMRFKKADVFQFLRESSMSYDLVILDPPAFAKRQKDIIPACRGYKDINRLAMQKMPPDSMLLTASCSYYVNEELFQKVLFQAAVEAKRKVRIIGKHRLALDHPINIFHPEGDYLKSFLLYLE